jgi:hypothetical protein
MASPVMASPVMVSPDADPGQPGPPWRVRAAAGPAGRPAIEIHAAGRIVDVLVAPALAAPVLRGACSVTQAGQRQALAWGYLPPGAGLSVVFSRGLAAGPACAARISLIAGWFWVAPAEGRFRRVTVHYAAVDQWGADRGSVDQWGADLGPANLAPANLGPAYRGGVGHAGGRERCRVRTVRARWPQHPG